MSNLVKWEYQEAAAQCWQSIWETHAGLIHIQYSNFIIFSIQQKEYDTSTSFLHCSSQVLDDRVEVLPIVWPFFCAFLSIALELSFLIFVKCLYSFSFIKFSPYQVFPYSLFLFHLPFKIVLISFQLILTEVIFIFLLAFEIS